MVKTNPEATVTSAQDAVARLRKHHDLIGDDAVDDDDFKFVIRPI